MPTASLFLQYVRFILYIHYTVYKVQYIHVCYIYTVEWHCSGWARCTHWSAVQQVRVFKANFFYTRPHSWLVVKGKVCCEPSWRQQIQLLKTRHIFPISICSDYVHSMYSVHCTLSKNNLNLAGHGWSGCTLYSMFGFVNIYLFQKADICTVLNGVQYTYCCIRPHPERLHV